MIDGETKVHCLYGFPISHSLSPIIFNNTFDKMNINRTYLPFRVTPDGLKNATEAARALGIEGFNVTMPHKTRIVEMLDELDSSAQESKSVNTVSRTPGGLLGHSTDGEGAVRAMKAHGFDPRDRKILILGAGGAARSIVHTLSSESANIIVLNRDQGKAQDITDRYRASGTATAGKLSKPSFEESVIDADLLIDATPIPARSLIATLGFPISRLPASLWVFDLVYNQQPPESLPSGIKRISGLEMLIQQAALSYEIWMHEAAPFELMRSILVEHVGGDWK